MKFLIEIACDNAAFHEPEGDATPGARAYELSRILRDAIRGDGLYLMSGGSKTLIDINGNKVGEMKMVESVGNDTDWVEVANRIEARAKASLEEHHGHFMTYLAEAALNLAKAMYHADSNNRKKLLRWFAPYLEEARDSTTVPGL